MKNTILSYLEDNEGGMFHFLERLVLQDSFSYDTEDVNKVATLIRDELAGCGLVEN